MKKQKKVEPAQVEIDAFKAGDYPQGKFTAKELSEIAESYNPENYEAPITIGHVSDYKGQTKIPAFGWIGAVQVVGDHLKLVASQFSEQLKGWVKEGLYKKVSAAFYKPEDPSNPTPGKWHLHHLAFLGAQPPQVKGLKGIAFSSMSVGLEFAEEEAQVSMPDLDPVEKAGAKDTFDNIAESVATMLKKIEEALASDVEYSVKQERMRLALYDCQSEVSWEIEEHFGFIKKLEDMEEKTEGEYSETIKTRLIQLAERVFHRKSRKEQQAMDAQKEKEYTDKITALEAQVKEFADAKAKADADAAAAAKAQQEADAKAADDKLRGEISEFCEKNKLNTKKADDLKVKDTLFQAAKVSAEFFEQTKTTLLEFAKAQVPEGVSPAFNANPTDDKRPEKIKAADKYVKDHPKEFADCPTDQDKINRAIFLEAQTKIRF